MCIINLKQTSKLLQDAIKHTADTFQSYYIHLIAHSIAAQNMLKQASDVPSKFLHHGKEALEIGHELESAEARCCQSEHASILLRRWWMMENLAMEEDVAPESESTRVMEEVRGVVLASSCWMDPLFTQLKNSTQVAKTLKTCHHPL